MQSKTDKIKPKSFPYTFYLMDEKQEKAYDEAIFTSYKGPVFWNDCGRDFIVDPNQPKENFQPENMSKLVYSSLKPIKIHKGGEKSLTVRSLCEAVAKVGDISRLCSHWSSSFITALSLVESFSMMKYFYCDL